MTLKKGFYKLPNGYLALVAQIKPIGTMGWQFRGAIKHEDVWYFHYWDINGNSNTGHPDLKLSEECYENK